MRSTETPFSVEDEDFVPSNPFDIPWHRRGNCFGQGYDNFFHDAKLGAMEATKKAKRVCIDCPVIRECLESALEHRDNFGVWGGYTPKERRGMWTLIDSGEMSQDEVLDRACD